MLGITVALALIFAALLALALRGRRVDEHPLCARCRFDLVGSADPTVCSECGADLKSPRGRSLRRRPIVLGNRRRMRRLPHVAATCLSLALAACGALLWAAVGGMDLNTRKPVWWLMWDARSAIATTADAALTELASRQRAGKLSAQQQEELLAAALEVQANPSRPWRTGWGDAVEQQWRAGALSEDQRTAYARHAIALQFDARDRVRQGDQCPVEMTVIPRVGSSGVLNFQLQLTEMSLAGQSLMASRFQAVGDASTWPAFLPAPISITPEESEPNGNPGGRLRDPSVQAAPGRHTAKVNWTVSVATGSLGGVAWWRGAPEVTDRSPPQNSVASWDGAAELPVEVIPASQDTVELVADKRLEESVRSAISVRIHETPVTPSIRGNRALELSIPRPPLDMAFVVRIEGPDGVHSYHVTSLFGQGSQSSCVLEPYPADAVYTVTLTPDPDLARRTVGMTRIWEARWSSRTSASSRRPGTEIRATSALAAALGGHAADRAPSASERVLVPHRVLWLWTATSPPGQQKT